MSGSRPLDNTEIDTIISLLKTERDKCMFIVGIYTGFRISELLSLTVDSVTQYGKIRGEIEVRRCNMKGKRMSRTVVLHPKAKEALEKYVPTVKGIRLYAISRRQAHRVICDAVSTAELSGKISTHSMRKTFAKRVYHALGRDLVNTQRAMGHASMNSTVSYLSFDQDAINAAIIGD